MREILFRGKRVDNGEWVEGYYVCTNTYIGSSKLGTKHIITTGKQTISGAYGEQQSEGIYTVIPETVGQYTGFEANGKKIFEGDIIQSKLRGRKEEKVYRFLIKYGSYIPSEYCKEKYSQCKTIGFYAFDGKNDFQLSNCPRVLENIGNIHDNPELLEADNGTVC
ncbi:MAG: hypothetical protein IJA60_02690 [Clostridia bacterium]|nr:hypothetical protein [Clostridia bacterium]